MHGFAVAVLLVVVLQGCSDGSAPSGSTIRTGTYDLTVTHQQFPAFSDRTATVRYTGTVTLTAANDRQVDGTFSLQKVVVPIDGEPGPPSLHTGQIQDGMLRTYGYQLNLSATGVLHVRMTPRGEETGCTADASYQDPNGTYAMVAACTLQHRGR